MKTMKDNHEKCDALLLADVFNKFKTSALKIMDYVWVIILAHHL